MKNKEIPVGKVQQIVVSMETGHIINWYNPKETIKKKYLNPSKFCVFFGIFGPPSKIEGAFCEL